MLTAELTGALLDYWTARAEGVPAEELYFYKTQYTSEDVCARRLPRGRALALHYSTDWAQGGPLIEKYNVCELQKDHKDKWSALCCHGPNIVCSEAEGSNPLQAICRAVVRAAFGDDVEEVAVHD